MMSEYVMLTKMQMYWRVTTGKGFLQHLRMPFDSPLHIKGVCSGASKVWISDYYYSGSDEAFWKKYRKPTTSHDEMVKAQDDRVKYSMGITLTHFANISEKDDPNLWGHAPRKPLRYYNLSFKKQAAHAMATYTPGSETSGHLFDPNLGQFDIGTGHYKDWAQLWADMWEYYDLYSVDVYSAELKDVLTFDMDS